MKTAVTAVISAGTFIFILLFSFQNCQNSSPPNETRSQALNSLSTGAAIDLNQESMTSVNFLMSDSKVVHQAGNSYQINYNKKLQIDLKTGEISVTNDLDSQTDSYCLTESLKNELVTILKSSQICKTQPNLPEGQVCTQALRLAYAQVQTQRENFDLGSATDGCGNNAVDLCGDQPNLLKGYIENIKKQYSQLMCQ